MTLATLALRNLARRPLRAGLAACGVALAVASFIALLGIARGHARAWERNLAASGTDVLASRKGAIDLLSTSVNEDAGTKIAGLTGVSAVGGELLDLVALDSGASVLVSGRPPASYLWTSLQLIEGRLPPRHASSEIAIGSGLASAMKLRTGSHLSLDGQRLLITGIVGANSALMSHTVYMPLLEMQRLVHRAGVVTIFNVRLRRPLTEERLDAFVRAASRRLPDLTFTATESIQDENPVLRAANALAWAVSVVALAMGLVGVINALLMSVTERIREIGVLAAVGWPSSRVLALIMCEGLLMASIGSIFGVGIGYLALRALTAAPQVAGLLEPEVGVRVAIEVVIATVLLGGVGGLYPAWRATQLPAVQALKHE